MKEACFQIDRLTGTVETYRSFGVPSFGDPDRSTLELRTAPVFHFQPVSILGLTARFWTCIDPTLNQDYSVTDFYPR
jgi:hypothetical protein